jgi:hypothetical protein
MAVRVRPCGCAGSFNTPPLRATEASSAMPPLLPAHTRGARIMLATSTTHDLDEAHTHGQAVSDVITMHAVDSPCDMSPLRTTTVDVIDPVCERRCNRSGRAATRGY